MEEFLIFLSLICLGTSMIMEHPSHTAVKTGSDARLNCTISTKDPHLAYWQAHTMVDSQHLQIYYSPQGALVDWIEPIEDRQYDLIVRNVNYDRAGAYKCDYLTAEIFSTEVQVMSMGDMDCGGDSRTHIEHSNVQFICSVQLTGKLNPSLQWYIGDRMMGGGHYIEQVLEEGEEEPAPNVPHSVQFYQNFTVTHEHDGQEFSCHLKFDVGTETVPTPPVYKDHCTTTLNVVYGATGIEFEPDPANWDGGVIQVKVGESIVCHARGNPEPMMMWNKVEYINGERVQVPLKEGEELVVTSEMYGENHYNCSAYNDPQGQPRYAYRAVKFFVDGGPKEAESLGNTASAIIELSRTLWLLLMSSIILQLTN